MLVLETSDTRLSNMKHQYNCWHDYTVQLVLRYTEPLCFSRKAACPIRLVYNLCASSLYYPSSNTVLDGRVGLIKRSPEYK